MIAAVGSILLTPWNLFNSPELIHYTLDVLGAFIGPLFGILIADFYLIKRGKVSVDDLFDDTPKGKYWYRNGFNPKAIGALIPSVAVGWSLALSRPCMRWQTSAGSSASSSAA